MKKSLIALALFAAASASFAADVPPVAVDAKIGFPGLTLSAHGPINSAWNWRADTTYGKLERSEAVDGNDYKATLKAQYTTVAAEFKPFESSSFYLVGGLAVGKAKASLTGDINQTFTYNGVDYNAGDLGTASAEIKNKRNTALFLGLGSRFGADRDKVGFYGGWELGAYVQKFEAKLTAACSAALEAADPTACATLQTNVQAEQSKLNDDVKKLKALPAFNVSLGYRF